LTDTARAAAVDFDQLVEAHRRDLHAHCYRMLGSLNDADDAVQDTLIRAWRALPKFRGDRSPRTWLYRIATNVCLTPSPGGPSVCCPPITALRRLLG
jgi:RNA polymerase sigma-70 factor, ECF subfamily